MKPIFRGLAYLTLSGAVVAGCVTDGDDPAGEPGGDPDVGELAQALTCPAASLDIAKSFVITDPAIVTEARFGLKRTLDAIDASVASSPVAPSPTIGASAPASATASFQQIFATFNQCASTTVDPNRYGLVCPRTAEAKLASANPFQSPLPANAVNFKPVALFNRFDQATKSTCGEYRIVYAKQGSLGNGGISIGGRGFLIFEGSIARPIVTIAGRQFFGSCGPIAQLWADQSTTADINARAAALETLYYTGLPGFLPAVHAKAYGYGGGAGQVRTNMFIDNAQWALRELKLTKTCSSVIIAQPTDPAPISRTAVSETAQIQPITKCSARWTLQPTVNQPAPELFAGTHAKSAAFQTAFLNGSVATLAKATNVNDIGMSTLGDFSEFESLSQSTGAAPINTSYTTAASAAFKTAIQAKLTALASTLTPDNVLERAEAQTCGGCHQSSSFQALGGGLTWPAAGGFVHVDESGNLSSALTTQFLPRRRTVMTNFLCSREVLQPVLADVISVSQPALPATARVLPGSQIQDGFTIAGGLANSAN